MRAAMASAKVGDDVYGEDPTTKLLEVFEIIVNTLDDHNVDRCYGLWRGPYYKGIGGFFLSQPA